MKQLCFLFFVIISTTAIAQKNIVLTWGAFQPKPKIHTQLFPLGSDFQDASNALFFTSDGHLQIYSKGNILTDDEELIKLGKNDLVLNTLRIPKRAYIFTSTENQIYAHQVRETKFELKEPKLITELEDGEKIIVKSNDLSKILFYNKADNKEKIVKLKIVDSTLMKQNEVTITAPSEYLEQIPAIVSNDGTSYFPFILKNGFTAICVSPDGKSKKTISHTFDDAKALFPVFATDENSLFVAVGYNKSNFEKECLEKIVFMEFSGVASKLQEKMVTLEKCLDNQMPIELYIKNRNELILVNEQFATLKKSSNNQVTYGSFILQNFNFKTGTITWQTEVFKNHYYVTTPDNVASAKSEDYARLTGHKIITFNNTLYILFNDNCSNCMNNGRGLMSQSALTKSCLNLVSVSYDGSINRHYYAGKINEKYLTNLNNCFQINGEDVFLQSEAGGLRIGRLKLN